jgi:rhodanese-related sulfurtransferase
MSSRRSNGQRSQTRTPSGRDGTMATSGRGGGRTTSAGRDTTRRGPGRRAWVAGGLLVGVIALVVGIAVFSGLGSGRTSAGTASSGAVTGTVIEANGGHWTNITPDTLDTMLKAKAFTLINVKTPYMGEIVGTDLWIPYTDVAAQASKLPTDKAALIVVYCRTGHESAIAAQTLLDLGYTNIDNLDGGMTAWTASGRGLVQVNRS